MLAECVGWGWIGCGGLFMLMGIESKYHSLGETYSGLDADGRRGMGQANVSRAESTERPLLMSDLKKIT